MSVDKLKKVSLYTCLYFAVHALALLSAPLAGLCLKATPGALLFPVSILAGLGIILVFITQPALKILLPSLWFTLLLIPYSTHLLGSNPDRTNSSKDLSKFLLQNQLAYRPKVVYDALLPSLAFELEKSIVTIQNKNEKLTRETQFERESEW